MFANSLMLFVQTVATSCARFGNFIHPTRTVYCWYKTHKNKWILMAGGFVKGQNGQTSIRKELSSYELRFNDISIHLLWNCNEIPRIAIAEIHSFSFEVPCIYSVVASAKIIRRLGSTLKDQGCSQEGLWFVVIQQFIISWLSYCICYIWYPMANWFVIVNSTSFL